VKTLVFVTGKFYYDITAERENNGRTDSCCSNRAIVYLPVEQMKAIIAQYPNADDYVWAQEEPKNMESIQLYVELDLVKWRLASLKPIQHQHQEVIQEQNAVMPMLLKWYLIKIYLDKN
jgi:2-oxoglutarate dehydrogenase E1 component